MSNELRTDCVIVGGGIGGAALALALAQEGFSSAIIEKSLSPAGTNRPEVLHAKTVQTLQALGVGDRIVQEAAIALDGLELFESGRGRLLQITTEDFRHAGARPYSTDPAATRAILLDAAQAHGAVKVFRGVEMRGLRRENGHIAGVTAQRGEEPLIFRAPLVVGDDGGHSQVRRDLGIRLRTRNFIMHFLGAVGPMLPGQPAALGRAYFNPAHVRLGVLGGVFMPLPGQRSAMALLLTGKSYEHFKAQGPAMFFEAAAELSPLCWDLHRQQKFPEGFGHFVRPFGHASRYVADGAALMGDAVHPVTPAGGQGANASIADAVALANVAAKALAAKDCSAKNLVAYEKERRPANAHALKFSSRADMALRLLHALPQLAPLYLQGLAQLNTSYGVKEKFLRSVSKAFSSNK